MIKVGLILYSVRDLMAKDPLGTVEAVAKLGYKNIWPLFGSANQLLSALALIACAVYLKKTNRKGWMLWIPMVIMLCVTLTALIQKIVALIGTPTAGNLLQLAFAIALFVLGVIVAVLGFRRLAEKTPQEAQEAQNA